MCFQRAFEPREEEEIKGILYGEILGQELLYGEFDTELIERFMQLGKCSASNSSNTNKSSKTFDDRRHRVGIFVTVGKLNVTLDCFCGRPVGTRVNSTLENPDVMPLKIAPRMGYLDPHPTHDSLGPPESTSQKASQSVQPLLQDYGRYGRDRQTDRQTTLLRL